MSKHAQKRSISIACVVAFALTGCGPKAVESPSTDTPAGASAAQHDSLEPSKLGSTKPVHVLGDLYLAGQPSTEDIDVFKREGVKAVVSLRDPDEIDWNEAAAVEAAGMEFVSIPIDGADALTDDVFAQLRTTLGKAKNRPMVLHCGSSNRVGAVWLPYRVLDEGVSLEQAVAEAKRAGLRSSALEKRAVEYIEQQQANK